MRLIWLCFIVTSLITEAGVDIMDIMYLLKDVKIYLNILKSHNNKCKNNFIILLI